MIDLATAICRLPGCGGPVSGVCINQLPFDECPDVIPAVGADEEEEDEVLPTSEAGSDLVSTGRTGVFSIAEADAFLRANGGVVLAVVAGPEVGKTTLASAIYELLHRGRLEGFGFAGSETIKGLEERCFDARVASDQEKASTLRTPRAAPLIFVHLRIAVPDGREVDVLLSDRSGEHFDRALNAPAEFEDFKETERADAILLLVDGENLVTNHQVEIARLRKLVMALSQAGHLARKTVHLVLTKADLINGEAQLTLIEQRAKVIAEDIQRRSEGTAVQIHLTACRAKKGQSTFGQGVHGLLKATLPPVITRTFTTTFWHPGSGGTPLDRLMFMEKWQ